LLYENDRKQFVIVPLSDFVLQITGKSILAILGLKNFPEGWGHVPGPLA